jgi:hypothetical protein
MKPINTLDEAHKYLSYIAETLYSVSRGFHIDKQDKTMLEKCANDLSEYSKGIEQLKNNMIMKEASVKKQQELKDDLEYKYLSQKRTTDRVLLSVTIAKNNLKKITKSGSQEEILKAKEYVKRLSKQYYIEKQQEEIMKREFDQEVNNGQN